MRATVVTEWYFHKYFKCERYQLRSIVTRCSAWPSVFHTIALGSAFSRTRCSLYWPLKLTIQKLFHYEAYSFQTIVKLQHATIISTSFSLLWRGDHLCCHSLLFIFSYAHQLAPPCHDCLFLKRYICCINVV